MPPRKGETVRLTVVSDGTPSGTKVIEERTGMEVTYVSMSWIKRDSDPFGNLQVTVGIPDPDEDQEGERAWAEDMDGIADRYARDHTEIVRQIKRRGGEVIVMEVVDGAIEVFEDVEVRRVHRSPSDPPKLI